MDEKQIEDLGKELYDSLRNCKTVSPITDRFSAVSIDDAYSISSNMLQRRITLDSERIVGKKIGVTSKPVQEMLGVFQPDFGFLTNTMEYADGAKIPIEGHLIQPRAEGEIAFRLKHGIRGPGVTEKDVLDATATIIPCFEIVDSRIADWNIKIQDTISDNASCGVYVLSEKEVDPRDLDLPKLSMKIFKNGELHSQGLGSAVQGNPLTAVAWLANTLGHYDIPFEADEIILSGSLVPLIPVVAGDQMKLEVESIGTCSCEFT